MSWLSRTSPGVKICGIRCESDARFCIEAGAAALGFNFHPGSKRFIDLDGSISWIRALGGVAERVAVVVNADSMLLERIRSSGCFEWIQFHGDESGSFCADQGGDRWLKAIRLRDRDAVGEALRCEAPAYLLDAWDAASYGGSGKTADWTLAAETIQSRPASCFALAGGLTPENVADALRQTQAAALDVAGGVEGPDGFKCPARVRAFVEAVKSACSNPQK